MNKDIVKYGLILLLLPILQEVLFNRINFYGYLNPLFYIIYIFIFPVYKEKNTLLIISFLLGLSIDILTNDGGIHAFALVFVAHIRINILNYIKGSHFSDDEIPNIYNLDNNILLFWILVITSLHHFIVFTLENFSFAGLGRTLIKTLLNTIFTTFSIYIVLQLFSKKKTNAW